MLSKDEIIQLLHSEETYRVSVRPFVLLPMTYQTPVKRDICSSELMMMERLAV